MDTSFLRPIALAAVMAIAAPASAQVYKWVDAQGRTHYGERPPEALDATKLGIQLEGNDPPDKPPGCYTIQCQYERMRQDRLIREAEWRKEMETRARVAEAQRAAQQRANPPSQIPHEPIYAPIYRRGIVVPGQPRPVQPPPASEPGVRLRMP
jgi:hypothetical protein